MDESNSAYRSHPLYPLLRDLVIAGMNFDDPKFHYQQLLSLLPHDFEKLLQNFLHRNPPSGNYQSNYSVESVLMDSLRLAHSHLVEKIRARQEQEKMKALTSTSIRSMEEFCEKFDHAQMVGMAQPGGGVNGCSPMLLAGVPQMAEMGMQGPLHVMTSMGPPTKVMVTLGQGGFVGPVGFRTMKDASDMMNDGNGIGAAAQKTESKKHPSLPKEAVSLMMEWLRGHKDNPYPNDDEKAMLIKQTGLTINQINYWFTNARRRILPKWAQCK